MICVLVRLVSYFISPKILRTFVIVYLSSLTLRAYITAQQLNLVLCVSSMDCLLLTNMLTLLSVTHRRLIIVTELSDLGYRLIYLLKLMRMSNRNGWASGCLAIYPDDMSISDIQMSSISILHLAIGLLWKLLISHLHLLRIYVHILALRVKNIAFMMSCPQSFRYCRPSDSGHQRTRV